MRLKTKNKVLVVSPIQKEFSDGEDLLFLGEWCKPQNSDRWWEERGIETVKYHWSDRSKLGADYHYLCELFDRLLPSLARTLNTIHQTNWSDRYWRILIGPWLAYLLHSSFDKWETIIFAKQNYSFSEVLCYEPDQFENTAQSIEDVFSRLIFSDKWNGYIFHEIIRNQGDLLVKYVEYRGANGSPLQRPSPTRKTIKNKLREIYNTAVGINSASDKYFFISTYLGKKEETILQLLLGQIPKLWVSQPISKSFSQGARDNFSINFESSNKFELFFVDLIGKQMPLIYIEGYTYLERIMNEVAWPKQPKVIFTSNSLWHDEVAKFYIAKQVERGAKLVYGQHGGFGIIKYSWAENHERRISDAYLTWGWTEPGAKNLYPVGVLKPDSYSRNSRIVRKKLLLVRGLSAQYPFRIDSDIGLPQILENINRCLEFARCLPDCIRKQSLIVRLYPLNRAFAAGSISKNSTNGDFYNEDRSWQQQFHDVSICNGEVPIKDRVNEAKLVVYSYNAGTGYLEFLASGVPTIIFWDMRVSPIRQSAMSIFDDLKRVGVFHDTPESAAEHVSKYWSKLSDWWESEEVKKVVCKFVTTFCKRNPYIIQDIKKIVEQLESKAIKKDGNEIN